METNRTLEIIRSEIERRLKKYATDVTMPLEALGKVILELKGILSFLSTIEPEKPMEQGLEAEIQNMLEQYAKFTDGRLVMMKPSGLEKIARYFAQWGAEHLAGVRKMIEPEKKEGRTDCSPQGEVPNDSLATQSYENIPKDLEEYASRAGFDYVDNIVQEHPGHRFNDHDVEYAYRDGIIAGAKWQKERMMDEWLKDRDGCFWDGVEEGKKAMEEQMMKDAVEYEVGMHGEPIKITLDKYVQRARGIFPGDKVRIIIVKEDKA